MAEAAVLRAVIITLCLSATCTGSDEPKNYTYITNEREIYDSLMAEGRYNKYVRPVAHENDPIHLDFGLSLIAIEDLHEKHQVLITHVWKKMMWIDVQLKWNPADYDNVSAIHLPVDHIWVPDIVPYNAVQGNYEFSFDAEVIVSSTGSVTWIPPIRLQTSCPLDMHKFPYDEHTCSIKFGSWTHEQGKINLSHIEQYSLDASFYQEHSEWELVDYSGKLMVTKYACCPEGYPDITYKLKLRRRPNFLKHVFVAPAVVLAFLIPVIFLLPPESGEKITMGTGVMVTLMLLLMMLENVLPSAHPTVPVIGLYYLTCMVMMGFSLGCSALITSVWYRSHRHKPVPALIRLVFLTGLEKLLCVSKDDFPTPGSYQPVSMRRLELENNEDDSIDGRSVDNRQQMMRDRMSSGSEWRQLAVVLDRLCFVLFFVVMFFITVSMAH